MRVVEREGAPEDHRPPDSAQESSPFVVALLRTYIEQRSPGACQELVFGPGRAGVFWVSNPSNGRQLGLLLGGGGAREAGARLGDMGVSLVAFGASKVELDRGLDALFGAPPFISMQVVRALAARVDAVSRPHLTAREREVLGLIVRGYSNREIADALCISQNTVRSHLQSASEALGVSSRLKLAARARDLGLA